MLRLLNLTAWVYNLLTKSHDRPRVKVAKPFITVTITGVTAAPQVLDIYDPIELTEEITISMNEPDQESFFAVAFVDDNPPPKRPKLEVVKDD